MLQIFQAQEIFWVDKLSVLSKCQPVWVGGSRGGGGVGVGAWITGKLQQSNVWEVLAQRRKCFLLLNASCLCGPPKSSKKVFMLTTAETLWETRENSDHTKVAV